MPFISSDYIHNKLMPAVDIVKLLGQYLPLKQRNGNYVCCCPFHQEKTPSFNVRPVQQMYFCFGCGAHGNAIDFLCQHKNLNFVEAIEELSRFTGIPIEYDQNNTSPNFYRKLNYSQEACELLDRIASFYSAQLGQNKEAYQYCLETRQLSEQTVIQARIGYAPDDFDHLLNAVVKNEKEYKILLDLGMLKISERTHKAYCVFRNRLMIPIFNSKGLIIGFGGRLLGGDGPKYLNSSDSAIFHKGREIFGLYESLQANNHKPECLFLVEGYMDVIALRQAGITFAVASLGTATTYEQFKLMFRNTKKIICCYDGDSAGQKAAWKALINIWPLLSEEGREVRFATVPTTYDPDSLVREQGAIAIHTLMRGALSLPEFILYHESLKYNLQDANELSAFLNAILSICKAMYPSSLVVSILRLLSEAQYIDLKELMSMMQDSKIIPNVDFKQSLRGENEQGGHQHYQNKSYQQDHEQDDQLQYSDSPLNDVYWGYPLNRSDPDHAPYNDNPKSSPYPDEQHRHSVDRDSSFSDNVPYSNSGNSQRRNHYKNYSSSSTWGDRERKNSGYGRSFNEAPRAYSEEKWQQRISGYPWQQYAAPCGQKDIVRSAFQPDNMPHLSNQKQKELTFTTEGNQILSEDLIVSAPPLDQIMSSVVTLSSLEELIPDFDVLLKKCKAVTLEEKQHFYTVVGSNLPLERFDFSSAVYKFIAFVLQEPAILGFLYKHFNFDMFLRVSYDIRLAEWPAIMRLLLLIRHSPSITSARLLEYFRNTEFEALFFYLAGCQCYYNNADGSEPTPTTLFELLGLYTLEVIKLPFEGFIATINSHPELLDRNRLEILHQLSKLVNHKYDIGNQEDEQGGKGASSLKDNTMKQSQWSSHGAPNMYTDAINPEVLEKQKAEANNKEQINTPKAQPQLQSKVQPQQQQSQFNHEGQPLQYSQLSPQEAQRLAEHKASHA